MIHNKNLKNLKKLIGISKLKFICDRYTIQKKKNTHNRFQSKFIFKLKDISTWVENIQKGQKFKKKNLVDFRNLISITGSLLVKGTADF